MIRLLVAAVLLQAEPRPEIAQGSIAVEPGEHCPGQEQVVAALESRIPGVVWGGPLTRRLDLQRQPPDLVLRLRSYDGRELYLERRLPLDPRAPSGEACEALAEAVAQVVVRYLREIGYRPPPPPAVVTALPPPPPREVITLFKSAGYLGVAAGVRAADGARGEAAVSFLFHRSWFAGELSAGATTETTAEVPGVPGATLRLRSFPLRLSAGPRLFGFVPAIGLGLDILSFRASGLDDARRGVRVEPAAEAGLSYLLSGRRLFARAGVLGGLTLRGHDFDAGLTQPVFRTPGGYLRAQIEVGVVLWKNQLRLAL